MAYTAKDYSKLAGALDGISETTIKNHLTLYQGYVNNTNKLAELTAALLKDGKGSSPEYGELKRRMGFEFDGMRLHEYYFENLGGKTPLDKSGRLARKLADVFGSYEAWEQDFRATGAMRGVGWAVLYQDGDWLFNTWINEHHVGHFAGCNPLFIMDAWEHAYMTDFGIKRPDYIAAFFRNVNWQAVESRLK